MSPLDGWLFSEVRRLVQHQLPASMTILSSKSQASIRPSSATHNGIDDHIRANEASARLLETIDAAKARAEITITQVRIRLTPLLRLLDGRQQLISGHVVVEEELRRDRSVSNVREMGRAESSRGRAGGEAMGTSRRGQTSRDHRVPSETEYWSSSVAGEARDEDVEVEVEDCTA